MHHFFNLHGDTRLCRDSRRHRKQRSKAAVSNSQIPYIHVVLISTFHLVLLTLPYSILIMASTSSADASARVHEPGSMYSSLVDGPGGFDRGWFMGTWGVAWSTLPMWNVGPVH